MPTGAIPTSKNNNPDKNNADDNNPNFYPDYNNPDNPCKLQLFKKNKVRN